MARSLSVIQRQIAKLQKEADAIKAAEVVGVVERIKTAIAFYSLTPADLFESKPRMGRPPKADGEKPRMGRPPKASGEKRRMGRPPKSESSGVAGTKKAPLAPRYRDEAGNAWSGHGKRPNWYKSAIEAGKSPEDLLVKPD